MYKPIKELGQNFLKDQELADRMVNALELRGTETILEIGPGLGILTDTIVQRISGTKSILYAVEVDERLASKLTNMYMYEANVRIVNANILDWLPTFVPTADCKIMGSLPFYITSPIIHKIIKMLKMPSLVVLLIQQEVADKISALPPDSSYMSSFVQLFYEVFKMEIVPREKFEPEPGVDGAVLILKKKPIECDAAFIDKFEGFLHKAYANPRKMLNKPFTNEELEKGQIKPTLRPQNLGAKEWLDFYKVLHSGN